nr:uncharacterized mitochondrial protein AtMg00810-like [Tanacetum cinerariifolium]
MTQTPARNHAQRENHQQYARMTLPNQHRHVVPTAVLTKFKLVLLTAARQVTTAVSLNNVSRPRPAKTVVTKTYSPPRRNITGSPSPKANAAFDGKEPDFDAKKPESEVNVSLSSSAQLKKQDDKTKKEAKGKSHVESFTRYRDLSTEFEDCSDNSINKVNVAGTLVPTVGQISPKSTNTFSAAGPSNAAASPTYGKSLFINASQLPDDLDMPELEDITYSDDEDDVGAEADFNNLETSIIVSPIPTSRIHKDHHMFNDDYHTYMFACFLLQEEPKRVHQALKDPSWIEAMQEELFQFKMQKGNPQHALKDKGFIDSGCSRHMTGNMSYLSDFEEINGRYVAFGGNLKGGKISGKGKIRTGKLDFDDVYFVKKLNFNLFSILQICDKKNNVLFTDIECVQEQFDAEKAREDNVQQYVLFPLWSSSSKNPQNTNDDAAFEVKKLEFEGRKPESEDFEDPDYPDKVYKMVKVLYGLHQAPRVWYETLANYLLENDFQRGKIDRTLFIKRQKGDILLVQIYVDDIIFGSTNKDLCKAVENLMKDKFQISSMGELTFFLGLQVKQKPDEIFISQDKYVAEILRNFSLTDRKSASTPIDTENPLLKDLDGEDVDVHTYRLIIGSLMYLTSSRPDIMFAVCACGNPETLAQVGDLSSHNVKYSSPALTQKVFSNIKRVGKGFFGVDTPLFEGIIVAQQADDVADEGAAGVDVDVVPAATEPSIPSPTPTTQPPPPSQELPSTSQVAQALKIIKLKKMVKKLERKNKLKVSGLRRLRKIRTAQRVESSGDTVMDDVSKHGEIIAHMDAYEDVTLKNVAAVAKDVVVVEKYVEIEKNADVQGRQADATITAATTSITAGTLTDAPSAARRRKGVVIKDPKETGIPFIIIHSEPKSKDKGKWIMVKEPKPLKKQAQIEQDEAYARELEAKLNKTINWDETKEQMEEEESRALKRESESQAEKAAKN